MTRQSNGKLHVFAGSFASRDEALLYTEAQWEPEPDGSVSDDEYLAWEECNPTWGLRDDLDIGLDADFIETIDGSDRYEYLDRFLCNAEDLKAIRAIAGDSNILMFIFPDALHRPSAQLFSTSKMIYCGAFDFSWP